MKNNPAWLPRTTKHGKLLATFGRARLMKFADGTCELFGGTPQEHGEAREWLSLFRPEMVLRRPATTRQAAVPPEAIPVTAAFPA